MTALDIPDAWRSSAEKIPRDRPRVILLLGGTDVGKSSYGHFLAHELVSAGQRVAIVDADIGQKSIGPPAAVTLAHIVDKTVEQRAIAPEAFYFVGSPDPMGHMLPLVIGTVQLVNAANASTVIVDTTGFIEGTGRILKGYEIDAIRPDLIVAIEKGNELESILRPHRAYRTIRVKPSRKARPRDRWQRDLARQTLFANYFASAGRLERPLDDVIFQRSLLFSGQPVLLPGALYAERTAEGVVAVAESPVSGVEVARWLKPGFEHGLLCGVLDERLHGVGLAIIENIDFGQRRLSVVSPVAAERLRVLQLGDLYLGTDGLEFGRVSRPGL